MIRVVVARVRELLQRPQRKDTGSASERPIHAFALTAGSQTEAALRESEARLRLVTESSNIGLWDWAVKTNDVYFSPVWKRQIGYEDHEIPHRFEEWRSRVHPDDIEHALKRVQDFLKAPQPNFENEYRLRHKDGSYRWMVAKVALIADAEGRPVRMLGSQLDITERKQTEMALRDSEEKFSAAFRCSPIALAIVGPDGRYVDANYANSRLSGYSREEIIGKRIGEVGVMDAEEAASLRAQLDSTDGLISNFELRTRVRDGSLRDIVFSTTALSVNGVPHRLSTFVDITERKRAERALRESEATLAAAFRSSPVPIFINTQDGKFVEANRAFCDLIGYSREEVIGRDVVELGLLSREDRDKQLANLKHAGEPVITFEVRARVRDGSFRDLVSSATTVSLHGVPHYLATGVDITERKQAEERIRHLNRTYVMLSDINQLIVREHEPQTIMESACRIAVEKGDFLLAWIGMWEPSTGRLLLTAHAGATPDTLELLERILSGPQEGSALSARALESGTQSVCNDVEHDPLVSGWREAALQRGYRAMASFPLVVNDQRAGTFNLYASRAGFFDAEELHLLDELARDIAFALETREREHERQRAVEELRVSEERFRELAETIQDVFWVIDMHTRRMLYVSPAYETIWQRSCQSLYDDSDTWFDAVHPDDKERVRQEFSAHELGEAYEAEYRIIRRDGAIRWIRAQAFPIRDTGGKSTRVVGVARDITEHQTLQEQLAQSQKMQAIGTLAGGIAHDFNNLLAAIIGNANLARMDLQDNPSAVASIREIVHAGQRAKELVQRILTFSRPQEHQLKPIHLQTILDEAVSLLRSTLPAGVNLQLDCADQLPAVRADASQIHQVVVNLATNAWHAMEGRAGRIHIRLAARRLDSSFCQAYPELKPGPHVCLSVSDTGKGMDAATIARIFEPFFTTKPPGQGAGLGLSVIHGIVRRHGGVAIVESKPGHGSTFQILLPASAEEAAPTLAKSSVASDIRGGGERILYLDDEESLVYLAVRFLERIGYRVEGFTRADEALAVFRANPQAFDLIITDFNMPGMSGMEVAQHLLRIRPDAPVVLASGYVRPAEVEHARTLGIREIVLKPNTVEELGGIVQRLLRNL